MPLLCLSMSLHVPSTLLPSLLASSVFLRTSQVFFALLLLASAVSKLLDMPGFYGIVRSYQLLPDALIAPAAWALSLTELALGAVLGMALAGLRLRPAAVRFKLRPAAVGLELRLAAVGLELRLAAAGLLVALHVFYLFGLTTALARGLALPNCGCFGVYWPRPLSAWSVVEDMVLLGWATAFYRGLLARQACSKQQHAQLAVRGRS